MELDPATLAVTSVETVDLGYQPGYVFLIDDFLFVAADFRSGQISDVYDLATDQLIAVDNQLGSLANSGGRYHQTAVYDEATDTLNLGNGPGSLVGTDVLVFHDISDALFT